MINKIAKSRFRKHAILVGLFSIMAIGYFAVQNIGRITDWYAAPIIVASIVVAICVIYARKLPINQNQPETKESDQ